MLATDIRTYFQSDIVEVLDGFDVTLTEDDFEDYQWWMSNLMQSHKIVLLGAFMGSGKTGCALHAFYKLWKKGQARKMLVIAPMNVAKDTWPDEIMAWAFAREFTYAVIVGTPDQRRAALGIDADVYIVNRENLRWLYETVGIRGWVWDTLVYDEASRLKSGDKRTKPSQRKDGTWSQPRLSHFGYLRKVRHKFERVWELSGTPAPNGVIDLWGPVYVLDQGARLGTSITAFRNRWFVFDGFKKTYFPRDGAEKEITDSLKGIFYCLKEEDYLKLPPLKVVDRWVQLSPADMEKYRAFERTLILKEYDVEAVNNGVLCNKLLQFANGSIYAEEDAEDDDWRKKSVARHIHDRKLAELGSVFEEAAGRSVLIAYSFKFDVQAIKKKYPWVRIYGETARDLQDWNRGKVRAMVLHPASAGHGLNFQQGGHIACWYGLNWSLELYQQFNRRLKRRGQTAETVWMYRILARGTNDARVAEKLEEKAVTQDRITDAFRVRIEDVRAVA